jgi:hypothetical protein
MRELKAQGERQIWVHQPLYIHTSNEHYNVSLRTGTSTPGLAAANLEVAPEVEVHRDLSSAP